MKAMKTQEVELSSLQDLLSQVKTELKATNLKNEELKKSVDAKTYQLKRIVCLITQCSVILYLLYVIMYRRLTK